MTSELVLSPFDVDPRTLVEAALCAEAAGFAGVWTYDHLSGRAFGGRWSLDVWLALAAIASATSTIGVGPLVVNATVRHPAHVALAAATLHRLSGGRARLGLGAGAGPGDRFAEELTAAGIPLESSSRRRDVVEDAARYIRAALGGQSRYDGPLFSFDGFEVDHGGGPAPEMVVGANGPRMATLAGRVADTLNVHSWEDDIPGLADAARLAASQAGRQPIEVTVESELDDQWLDPASPVRQRLAEHDITRVMLRWTPAQGLDAIERAAKYL